MRNSQNGLRSIVHKKISCLCTDFEFLFRFIGEWILESYQILSNIKKDTKKYNLSSFSIFYNALIKYPFLGFFPVDFFCYKLFRRKFIFNLHKDGIEISCKYIRKSETCLNRLYLIFFYLPYYFIDIFSSLPRIIPYVFCNKKGIKQKENIVNNLIDLSVSLLFISAIIIYSNYDRFNSAYLSFYCSFFVWRIIVILIYKLKEIADIGLEGRSIVSFPRTLLITFINFFEIILGFSFLNDYFNVTTLTNKCNIFIETLLVFTTMDFNLNTQCTAQKVIIFFEILAFLIFVIFFIANIANLKRKE